MCYRMSGCPDGPHSLGSHFGSPIFKRNRKPWHRAMAMITKTKLSFFFLQFITTTN